MEENKKPTREEVLAYTEKVFNHFMGKRWLRSSPPEQREEMLQEAFIRVLNKYDEFEVDRSWKSLVSSHARGAILDYLKAGNGFEESRWSLQKPDDVGSVHAGKLQTRIALENCEGEDSDVDEVAGRFGVFQQMRGEIQINWDLLAKLCAGDSELKVFAWWLRGFTYEEIGAAIGVKTARVGQIVGEVINRFDDPTWSSNGEAWLRQISYALGISELLGFVDRNWDGGFVGGGLYVKEIGVNNSPVDLDNLPVMPQQASLFEDHNGQEAEG